VELAAVVLCAALSFSDSGRAPTDSTVADSIREAIPDSTKAILLETVVVSSPRNLPNDATWIPSSARHLYADDGAKLLLSDLRITSPLPASAELRLHGLPVDQTAREYVWGHRIGGPMTAVFGLRSKINPDMVRVALHPFLMPHQYRDTNGSLELRPTFQSSQPLALSLSSDVIERRATLWVANGASTSATQFRLVTSLRQSDVAPFLEAAVPQMRMIPRYLDSQTHASVRIGDQTVEGFFLFGAEKGDWRETIDGVDGAVLDNSRQNLAVVRWVRPLPGDSKLTAGISWEADYVNSEFLYGEFNQSTRNTSHIVNPRIVYSTRRDALTAWVSQFRVESEPGGSHASVDGGVESRATLGWLTVQPSLAFQQFRDEVTVLHGVTAKVHPDQITLTAGYGTYADYFEFHDGMFGNVFDPGAAQQPQYANHYVASVQYEPKRKQPFDLFRVTGVQKDLAVDLWGSRSVVHVLSWDFMVARSGNLSWELACLANDARRSDGPLVGVIPFSLRAGVNRDVFRSCNVSVEANYHSSSLALNRTPGSRSTDHFSLGASHYLNVAVTQRFIVLNRPAHLTVTVFNALAVAGSRAELTVDQYGRRYHAPCWANVRLRYDLW
jgi:hypothetical protein